MVSVLLLMAIFADILTTYMVTNQKSTPRENKMNLFLIGRSTKVMKFNNFLSIVIF